MKASTFPRRLAVASAFLMSVVLQTLAAPAASLAANAPPTISSFSPTSGSVGTLVTIHGTHFGSPAPGLQVLFNGTMATPETVVPTKITVRVPPLATTGPIMVKTRYGTAETRSSFRLTRGIASFPKGAWPGQEITVAGSGFVPFHDLTLKLDGSPFGGVATDANGNFSLLRTLPPDITVGAEHILAALDTITHVQPKIHIWIFGNWPQPRNDAAQTSNGTAEFLISTSNVAKAHQFYATSAFLSPVVEDGGNVYLGYGIGADNYVAEFNLVTRKVDWAGPTDGPVTQAPAVVNGVVYAVTDDKLYAYAEHPSGNPRPFWTAVLGDSAHPFAPVVADGRVYVADGGLGELQVFDANGVTNCPAVLPPVCTPLWFASYSKVFGPPAIDAITDGGNGDVYLSVQNGTGVNKVVVRTGAGATAGSSAALASTSLTGPSLAGGRVFVSGWSAASTTATLYALDASTQALQWNSINLGGASAPTAVAVGEGHAVVQNSDGILRAFKPAGCGFAVCGPQWTSPNFGPGGTTPPTVANGLVYMAAGRYAPPFADLAGIEALDASSGAYLAAPNYSGINSQIVVVAGTIFGQGHSTLSVAELP